MKHLTEKTKKIKWNKLEFENEILKKVLSICYAVLVHFCLLDFFIKCFLRST